MTVQLTTIKRQLQNQTADYADTLLGVNGTLRPLTSSGPHIWYSLTET
jgi:hypothetical protein